MATLSEEGSLYLEDYVILDHARRDLFEFLTALVNQVEGLLQTLMAEVQAPPGFVWEIENTRAGEAGYLEINATALSDTDLVARGRYDICVIYNDVRYFEGVPPKCISLAACVTKKFIGNLRKLNVQRIEEASLAARAMDPKFAFAGDEELLADSVDLDLAQSDQSAKAIADRALVMCNAIGTFLTVLTAP